MGGISLEDRNSCPLCGEVERSVAIQFPEIPVVRCERCGFLYSSRILPGSNFDEYYSDHFGSERHRRGQIVNSVVNASIMERLLEFQQIGSLLDVGTGYGFLLQRLRERHSLRADGVELSKQESVYARDVLGLNVINLPLAEAGLPKDSYDLVTSFEVIEHVRSPIAFLLELIGMVKVGGYLLIMTDNFEGRMARALGAGFPKWIPHAHISHFTMKTLRQTLEQTQRLEIVTSVSYSPWELVLRYAYYRFRGIRRTPRESFDLSSAMQTEMEGTYPFFVLRKYVNKYWALINQRKDGDGDLMYFLCKRTS